MKNMKKILRMKMRKKNRKNNITNEDKEWKYEKQHYE